MSAKSAGISEGSGGGIPHRDDARIKRRRHPAKMRARPVHAVAKKVAFGRLQYHFIVLSGQRSAGLTVIAYAMYIQCIGNLSSFSGVRSR